MAYAASPDATQGFFFSVKYDAEAIMPAINFFRAAMIFLPKPHSRINFP
jgi:hypothetical protein